MVVSSWQLKADAMGVNNITDMLCICAENMDSWGFRKYVKIKRYIKILQLEIELKKPDNCFGPNLEEITAKERSLEVLYTQDEIYWK